MSAIEIIAVVAGAVCLLLLLAGCMWASEGE